MRPPFDSAAPAYIDLFATLEVRGRNDEKTKEVLAETKSIAAAIVEHRDSYQQAQEAVATILGVPWFVIALIHNMECGLRFDQHLHNGDPLTRRTRNDPAGRPQTHEPPFTWLESAVDALNYERMANPSLFPSNPDDWPIARICYFLEGYNGWGYRAHGIHSPYLYSGSNHEQPGKYVSDGVWDASARSSQIGAITILKWMTVNGMVAPEALSA